MALDVFVINLPHRTDKKEDMLKQAEKFGIPIKVIEAVNGNALTDEQIQELVYDYPACCLTKGVIGCSLSHIKVYQTMVDEQIPLAAVLEDDAIMTPDLQMVLERLSELDHNEKPMMYMLSSHYYEPQGEPLIGKYSLHKYIDGGNSHAYVVNLKAAQTLHEKLLPVLWEADKWYYFAQLGYTEFSCVVPHVVRVNGAPAYSDLFEERSASVRARRKYLGRLKKVVPWREKIKKFIWKATKRPSAKKS